MSTNNIEYGRCHTCKYESMKSTEEPCINCKNNRLVGTEEYDECNLLWNSDVVSVNDEVFHPAHYNQGSIECIHAMEAAYGKDAVAKYCICNAFKYLWRTEHKNGIQDIDKAIWYLNKFKGLKSGE